MKPTKKTAAVIIVLIALAALAAKPRPAQAQPAGGATVLAGQILPAGDVALRDDYTIVVDGRVVSPDVPPVELNGVIFVPLRFIGDALGARKTDWNPDLRLVTIQWDGSTLKLTIGKAEVDQDGAVKTLEAPPFIYEGRTMVPLKISAQSGGFIVQETGSAMVMSSSQAGPALGSRPPQAIPPGTRPPTTDTLKEIREKAKHDPITKKLKWIVIGLWAIAGALWLVRLIGAFGSDEKDRFKDKILILLILAVFVPMILIFMLSTWWAAAVAIVTCIVGLVSTEEYCEKLVTMAGTAQGVGLICTLFGLGLLIGPAIANRDIHAIGYGIYVKIEPTITGLSLSIIMNMLFGYEARKQRLD